MLSEYSQLKLEITYNPVPAAASSFITLLHLPCTHTTQLLSSSAPVDASGQDKQLEHKLKCFKPNLLVFLLCTIILISSGTKLPEEQEGCSRVSGAHSAALRKGTHEIHGHLFTRFHKIIEKPGLERTLKTI